MDGSRNSAVGRQLPCRAARPRACSPLGSPGPTELSALLPQPHCDLASRLRLVPRALGPACTPYVTQNRKGAWLLTTPPGAETGLCAAGKVFVRESRSAPP